MKVQYYRLDLERNSFKYIIANVWKTLRRVWGRIEFLCFSPFLITVQISKSCVKDWCVIWLLCKHEWHATGLVRGVWGFHCIEPPPIVWYKRACSVNNRAFLKLIHLLRLIYFGSTQAKNWAKLCNDISSIQGRKKRVRNAHQLPSSE